MARMSARTLHTIADELGVAPELVGALVKERKLTTKESVRQAVAEYKAKQEGTKDQQDATATAAKPEKKKKAGLTLSQRRALLRLLDNIEDGFTPASAFKSLPYQYLESVGLAVAFENEGDDALATYRLTDEGIERASSINPGYRDWSAGETVVIDPETGEPVERDPETGEPIRQPHGTHRAKVAAERAAKAAAEAEAKAKADAEAAAKEQEKDAVTA